MTERGLLGYTAPKSHLIQRGFVLFSIGFGWFVAAAVVYLAITGEMSPPSRWHPLLIWVMLPIVVFGLLYLPSLSQFIILHPQFRIYDHGITTPIQSVFTSREGRFIPFSTVKAYGRSVRDPRMITVYLSETEHISYSHVWTYVMDALEEKLIAKGLAEMPWCCPECGQRLHNYFLECPGCKSPIILRE